MTPNLADTSSLHSNTNVNKYSNRAYNARQYLCCINCLIFGLHYQKYMGKRKQGKQYIEGE